MFGHRQLYPDHTTNNYLDPFKGRIMTLTLLAYQKLSESGFCSWLTAVNPELVFYFSFVSPELLSCSATFKKVYLSYWFVVLIVSFYQS